MITNTLIPSMIVIAIALDLSDRCLSVCMVIFPPGNKYQCLISALASTLLKPA